MLTDVEERMTGKLQIKQRNSMSGLANEYPPTFTIIIRIVPDTNKIKIKTYLLITRLVKAGVLEIENI